MRKILSFFIAILFASSMMAEVGSLYYTFLPYKPSSGAVSDYTKTGTMTIDEMKWTVPGNWYATGGLRLGGKSLSGVDRTIIGQDPMGSAISKIRIAHAGVTSDKIVLNSVTVTTASDADFTQDVTTKTVTEFTVAKNTKDTIDVVPTTEPWAINSYYKVAFNFTNSVNSNYAFVVESILFYAYAEGGGDDPQPTEQTLYLKISSDWEYPAKYAVYYFEDGKEPGWSEFMTEVEGEDNTYTATIPVGYSKVIFVRLDGAATEANWDNKWSQTVNLDVPTNDNNLFTVTSGGTGSECDGTWSEYVPAKPAEDITFYLVNKQGWEAPKAFVFNATASEEDWPGKAMTKTENTVNGFDVYSYTFKDNFTSIIFNNGAATGTIQTADLAWDATKPYFVPGKVNGEGKFEGTWYASLEAIPAPVYNIAGAFTGWKPYALNVANDKNTATLDVQLPAGEYEFKVVRIEGTDTTWYTKNNGDAGAYGLHREYVGVAGVNEQADNNLKVTADEAGAYLFTWTFANDSVGITFPAKHVLNETWSVDDKTAVAAETQYVDNYAINIKSVYGTTLKENARTFGGFAFSHVIQVRTDGYPSATNLVGAEKSGSTSLVITAKEDVEITMYYNRQVVSGAGTENDNKDIIVVDQAAPTTKLTGAFKIVEILSGNSYLNATKTLSLTKGHVYTVTASGTTLQLSGIRYASDAVKDPEMQIAGAWDIQEENWVVNNMTLAQDKKTATYEVELAKGEYEFKVIKDGAWLTKDNGEAGAFGLHRGYPGVAGIKDDAANNLKVTADVSGAYLFTWTLANDSLNIAFPALPKFCVTGDSALVVDAGLDKAKAWNDEAFMSNADEFVLTGLKADQEYHLQVIVGEAWKGYSNLSEKAAGLKAGGEFGNNIVFKLAEAGDVKVTYKAAEGETPELFKLEGNFYVRIPVLNDLYLVPNKWAQGEAKIAAWTWSKTDAEYVDQWTPFFAPKAEGNDTLTVKLDAAVDSIIFVRFKNDADEAKWDGGEGYIWNTVPKDSVAKESMVYTITDWEQGTWDVYHPITFYITGNEDIVGEGNPTWGKNGALESFTDTLVMNLAAGFHKFKLITPAEQWLGMEALTDTAYGLFTDDDTNICFNIAEAGEVTVIYNATEFKVEGDFYIAPVANYYLIGDSAFVVDAGATADKAWTPDAIPSFQDTTVLHLKAGVNYIMRLSLEGTWENHRDFRHLTDTAAGLIELPDEFGNHSIGFSLAEAGDVTIIYIPAANEQPEVFKLIGNFYVAPAPDPTVAVMGSMNEWAEEIPFVLSDDKTYASLTVENIGADEYEFKFIINGEWRSNGYRFHREFTGAAGITENNDADMVFVADQDGKYTFYWYFANDSAAIVYPEYIEPAKEYYAKYAPAWEWVKMTEEEGLWLTDTIVYGGIGVNINDAAADENNMFYSNTVEEQGVRPIAGAEIDVNDTIYFTFNPADSVVTAVMVGKYIAPDPTVAVMGSMNEWAEEIPFVLSDDKTYASLTVENIGADEYEFKFIINGEWRSNGYRFHREFTGAAGITENNEANMVFVADVDGEYTFYWYFANDSAAIVYPEKPEPVMDDGYYIIGLNGWNVANLTADDMFWSTGIETNEFSINLTLRLNDEFKVVRIVDDMIQEWYPAEGGNYVVDDHHYGATTVYFRPNYDGNEDWFAGCIYVLPTSTVDIDNLDTNAPAVKILRDGQILIIKGNKTFNIQGQLVK